jgi:hypothetical protein
MQVQISSAYPLSSAIPSFGYQEDLGLTPPIQYSCTSLRYHLALDSEMLIHRAASVVMCAELDVITALIGDFRVARGGVKEGLIFGQVLFLYLEAVDFYMFPETDMSAFEIIFYT